MSFYLPPRGWEFFGCGRGEGVSLPTTEGMGVFWLREGRGCLSTYRRGSREFFGCRQDKGVSLPTAAEGWSFLVAGGAKVSFYLPPQRDGVFWLQEGQRCPSTYRRRSREFFGCAWGKGVSLPTTEGAGSFLVARGAKVSLYLPPRGMEFFGCAWGEGVLLPTAEGQEQKNAHPAGGMGGGGLLRAYNWSAADTIRTHLDGETNSPYPKPYNTPY